MILKAISSTEAGEIRLKRSDDYTNERQKGKKFR